MKRGSPRSTLSTARLPDLVVIDINLKDEVEGGFELMPQTFAAAPRLADHFSDGARQRIRRRIGISGSAPTTT